MKSRSRLHYEKPARIAPMLMLISSMALCLVFRQSSSNNVSTSDLLSPVPDDYRGIQVYAAEPEPTPAPSKVIKTGFVSYYTIDGCLGCNPSRITASGDVLDDSEFTLAIPSQWRKEIPMGTRVKITNLDNGLSVYATVNDTGGFLKYNRIADLSFATCQAVKCKTDKSRITLEF